MRVASADEERAVVGDEQQRAGEIAQVVLEPPDRVDVEVVGRLVEQQQIRLRDQRLAEQRAPAPAAGQLAHRAIGRQRQPRHDHRLDSLLEPPAVALLELVLQLAEPLERRPVSVGRVDRRVVVVARRASPSSPSPAATSSNTVRSAAPGTSCSSRAMRRPGRAPDRCRRRAAARPTIDLEQARLAGAVAADEADALAGSMRRSASSNSGRWPKASETESR